MGRGAWKTTVHGVTKSPTRLNRLSIHLLCTEILLEIHLLCTEILLEFSKVKVAQAFQVAVPSPGIFLTQRSNPGLLYCRRILYQLSHKGSP